MPVDLRGRPLGSLRISVTDRCNLRCSYCMPEPDYVWLPKEHLLTFDEITAVATAAVALGATKLRLTGGEPLVRTDVAVLAAQLAAVPGVEDLALTTNGVLLGAQAAGLAAAGVRRVTVSLDTLRRERFRRLSGSDRLGPVLEGLRAAVDAGLPLKINTVVVRGRNDDELEDVVALARELGAEARFIEYMDVGGATCWEASAVVPRAEILARLEARFGRLEPLGVRGAAPAERFALPDGSTVGVIASTTAPFCRDCDRARLTADGRLFLCLYGQRGHDARAVLRAGGGQRELLATIRRAWQARADRGAEERLALGERGPLFPKAALREDPHLEMHTRGG